MKFQYPLIKSLVIADSPACFDISRQVDAPKQHFKNLDQVKKGSPEVRRDILTYSECSCQCTCTCTCTCVCECTCQCKCQCETPGCIIKIPFISPAEKILFGSGFMLRREEFGGLLFDMNKLTSFICNFVAYEILSYIKGKDLLYAHDLMALVNHIKNVFEEVPGDAEDIVRRFICSCTQHRFLEGATS
ncbi:hypothetical protein MAMMFC1_01988 [Methylomusa anaerophila]|uniref:Uncharacterized protein n=1 Tax=Methylomusa anaerophila TaxID=1930071 RepID=A0A348AJR2_9FIRM|nr:hypothetical protein MAMMFC1_01988 [Methylomusa anaerophila]